MIALVVNPTKVRDVGALRERVAEAAARYGLPAPQVWETTEQDPGEQVARQALDQGAELVLAAGGDGTVRAVCCALQRSGVPLGVLPLGTGNLLARNLDLPLDLGPALDVALTGRDRVLDLGHVRTDAGEQTCFAVMAGLGFDAQMMADAPERLKALLGWPAYVVSGLRHLRDRPVLLRVAIDGGTPVPQRARGLVVGNVGQLQGGVSLLPHAHPDDELLDVVVLAPRRLRDWGRVIGRLATGSSRHDRSLLRARARTLEVRSSVPVEAQVDGEPLGRVTSLRLDVCPGALVVRVAP